MMRVIHHRHQSANRKGFALMIALLLMAFMVVLLLSLSSLTQVQMQSASTESQMKQARSNAMLGLNIALARLEELTLSDTVATAPASLFIDRPSGSPSDNSSMPADAKPQNENWVGVWDSSESAWNPTAPNSRTFKGWLVSNSNFDTADAPDTAPNASQAVPLLRADPLSGSDADSGDVYLDPVPLDERGTNKYAFWIADESLKASIGLYDPWGPNAGKTNPASTPAASQLKRNIAQKSGQSKIEGLEAGDFYSRAWEDNASKLVNWEGLSNASTTSSGWNTLKGKRHDVTYNARGLLTNARKGGWRKDLTLAFTNNNVFDANLKERRVFHATDFGSTYRSSAASNKSFFGPRWEALRSFHQLHTYLSVPENVTLNMRTNAPMLKLTPDYVTPGGTVGTSDDRFMLEGSLDPGHSPSSFDTLMRGDGSTAATSRRDFFDFLGKETPLTGPRRIGNNERTEVLNSPLSPVITYFAIVYRLSAFEDTTITDPLVTDRYRLRISYYPVIQLWNPYNVRLQKPSNGMHLRVVFSPRFTLRLGSATGTIIQAFTNRTLNNFTIQELHQASGRSETAFTMPSTFTMEPGEIRTFALTQRVEQPRNAQGDVYYITRALESEWNSDGEIFFPDNAFDTRVSNVTRRFSSTDRIYVNIAVDARNYGTEANATASARISSHPLRMYYNEYLYLDQSATSVITQNATVASLLADPLELAVAEGYIKPGNEYNNNDKAQLLGRYNPAAIFRGHQGVVDGTITQQPFAFEFKLSQISGGYNPATAMTGGYMRGFWGDSLQAGGGKTQVILYDVPRTPLHSLGQLQHANISLWDVMPAYAIGNSIAPDNVNSANVVDFVRGRTQIDYSWMLNHNLWDEYFFSTLPAIGSPVPTDNAESISANYLRESKPLPNSRYQISLLNDDPTDAYIYDSSASQIIVNGAFNVNSTSVEAWKAVFSSLGEQAFSVSGGASAGANDLKTPFYRHGTPIKDDSENWQAGWVNVDDKLEDLAKAMVEEVKRRGPFMSIADFVNRRLGSSGVQTEQGALQAAINESDVNDNKTPLSPGALSQGDILQAIGPFITTRGDTFLIRSYGSVNQPGQTTPDAESWVEAVVRRTPDREDTTKRRYVIDSIRWLNKEEL